MEVVEEGWEGGWVVVGAEGVGRGMLFCVSSCSYRATRAWAAWRAEVGSVVAVGLAYGW